MSERSSSSYSEMEGGRGNWEMLNTSTECEPETTEIAVKSNETSPTIPKLKIRRVDDMNTTEDNFNPKDSIFNDLIGTIHKIIIENRVRSIGTPML